MTMDKIRLILKKQFGSAMSNSDLVELRTKCFHGFDEDINDLKSYKKYFGLLYNFIFELRFRIETEGNIDLKKFERYSNEAFDLRKLDVLYKKYKEQEKFKEILNSLPKELKDDKIWLKKFKESIEDYKNSHLITFEDYKKS